MNFVGGGCRMLGSMSAAAWLVAGCTLTLSTDVASQMASHACPRTLPAEARCGVVSVQETPDALAGRTLDLAVVVLPAHSDSPRGAVLSLAGGPGQASAADATWFVDDPLREHYDLVLYDQRGTGSSNGLYCPLPREPNRWFSEGVFSAPALRRCRKSLEVRADLGAYTTGASLSDTDHVLDALGYDAVHIRAGSYGTRLAIAYAAHAPDRVRSLVLQGAVPPTVVSTAVFGPVADRSLDRLIADCEADLDCPVRDGVRDGLARALALLDAGPIAETVEVADAEHRVLFDRAAFAYAVRGLLYGPTALELPVRIVESAASGSFAWFAQAYADRAQGIWTSLAMGMHLSVVCGEDVPYASQRSPGGGLMQNWLLEEYREACSIWDVPRSSRAHLGGETVITAPVLIFSGRRDPVSPSDHVALLEEWLPRLRSVVFERGGHGYPGGPSLECVTSITTGFLDTLRPEALDVSCSSTGRDPWARDPQ